MVNFSLNENQKEYLIKANKMFNVKSKSYYSGAHYLDFNFLLMKRSLDAEKEGKDGISIILFNHLDEAKTRLGERFDRRTLTANIYGKEYEVAASSGNPKRLRKLLSMNIKHIYGTGIEEWKEELFNSVIYAVKQNNCIFDGVVTYMGVPSWIAKSSEGHKAKKDLPGFLLSFANEKQESNEIYLQDNFSIKNNKFGDDGIKKMYLRDSMMTKEGLEGYKFIRVQKE